ncbi:MAG: PTS mannose transporter subunit IIA [Nocardioides sp.]|nr:PTS mannose transporter subunit IIA [Nocardioides sp.]
MATTTPATGKNPSARLKVQAFGTFLSNMVMPNIGAFIAWGLITAMFIEVGWLPRYLGIGDSPDSWVAKFGGWGDFDGGGIVGPMIVFLLPLLIGYTGGKMGYGNDAVRGGVVGAIATMGVIVGTDIPMFMGAMIMGPLGGWSMRKVDSIWDGKIEPGFEMLVNNFAAGIWGMVLTIVGFVVMSPVVTWISDRLGEGVNFLVNNSLLPFTSIIIEPAKVLFLNNALNHGVLTPLGTTEASETGKSILFLLEANPAAGAGLLLAIAVFGKGAAKASAPGALLIHFVGGIHEIYFPYVLMKPKLILAMIAGGFTQILVNVIFDSGLRAPAAPGSVLAVYAQTPGGSIVGVTLSIIAGAAATFVVAAILLKFDKSEDAGDELVEATARMEALKGKSSSVASVLTGATATGGPIRSIVFACDAGMGSSAMGASLLRKKVQAAGYGDVTVVNKAIANLSDTFDLVVTHQDLTPRAQQKTPSAVHVSVDNFMASPRYDEIVELLAQRNGASGAVVTDDLAGRHAAPDTLLDPESVQLDVISESRDQAIDRAGRLLMAAGAVDDSYVASMHDREATVSTYMGNLLALPHGTNEAKAGVRRSAIAFVRYPQGVDWNGKQVKFVVGVAAQGDDHLALLSRIAQVFSDESQVARLEEARTTSDVMHVLGAVQPA